MIRTFFNSIQQLTSVSPMRLSLAIVLTTVICVTLSTTSEATPPLIVPYRFGFHAERILQRDKPFPLELVITTSSMLKEITKTGTFEMRFDSVPGIPRAYPIGDSILQGHVEPYEVFRDTVMIGYPENDTCALSVTLTFEKDTTTHQMAYYCFFASRGEHIYYLIPYDLRQYISDTPTWRDTFGYDEEGFQEYMDSLHVRRDRKKSQRADTPIPAEDNKGYETVTVTDPIITFPGSPPPSDSENWRKILEIATDNSNGQSVNGLDRDSLYRLHEGTIGLTEKTLGKIDSALEYFGPDLFPELQENINDTIPSAAISVPLRISSKYLDSALIIFVRRNDQAPTLNIVTTVKAPNTDLVIPIESFANQLSAGVFEVYLFNSDRIVAKDRFVLLR